MEIKPFDAQASPDRFSTSDEIRAALSFMPEFRTEASRDELWEVESDFGGHVLIEAEDKEVLTLLEQLDVRPN